MFSFMNIVILHGRVLISDVPSLNSEIDFSNVSGGVVDVVGFARQCSFQCCLWLQFCV